MNAMVCGGWREAATNKHLLSSEKIHGTANPGSEQWILFGPCWVVGGVTQKNVGPEMIMNPIIRMVCFEFLTLLVGKH